MAARILARMSVLVSASWNSSFTVLADVVGPCRYSGDDDDDLADWKPSVYWVMLILFVAATIIACCAAALYHVMEQWSYLDSLH